MFACDHVCGVVATDSYQLDLGVLASVHTAPVRRPGAFDFHAALGIRPYAHIVFGDSGFAQGSNQLTAVTFRLSKGHLALLHRMQSVRTTIRVQTAAGVSKRRVTLHSPQRQKRRSR